MTVKFKLGTDADAAARQVFVIRTKKLGLNGGQKMAKAKEFQAE
jgi:hypothetical protein